MSDGRTWGTVIGGIIGYFVPVIGWAAGAAIGGAVGGLLEPTKKVEQGRIDDLKVSVSQYGAGIPETWGNNVPPATWVWATDVIEIGQTQGGGKGGGGTEVTQYRQFIHGYLVLGRTPPVGSTIQIRKAWVDGKLTYDASSGLSVAQALASEENPFAQISLHPGWEDQIPHPIMEFYEGIGNTPAYRGVVGVFVFGLECPGGRIPQLSFEIAINAVDTTEVIYGDTVASSASKFSYSRAPINGDPVICFEESGRAVSGWSVQQKVVNTWALGPDYFTKLRTMEPHDKAYNFVALRGSADIDAICFRNVTASNYQDQNSNIVLTADGDMRVFQLQALAFGQTTSCWSKKNNRIAFCGDDNQSSTIAELFDWGSAQRLGIDTNIQPSSIQVSDDYVWVVYDDSGTTKVQARDLDDFSVIDEANVPSGITTYTAKSFGVEGGDLMCFARSSVQASLWRISFSGGGISFTRLALAGVSAPASGSLYAIGVSGLTVVGVHTPSSQNYQTYVVRFGTIVPTEAPIDEVIESQCERVGLSGKIDVSTIDDTVWGYTFNKSPASARNNIAPLLTYAGVAQVEEDGIIRFFHRGDKTPVENISYDELGCTEDGQEPGDPFPLTRTQEAECPRSVTVQYVNPFFDYQTSTETARRIVADSELDETVTLDVAMTPDKAATIAHRTLYERWIARDTRSFKVSRKFAALSPGDVVTIEYPRGTTGNYMLAKVNDTGALIEAECVPADAELLTQSIPGTNGYTGQQIAPLAPPTLLTVVDSRILRDADNNAGLYAALAGFGPGWSGAELWAGDDANALIDRGGVSTEAIQGVCETTLGNYTLGNVDEHNLLTVNVGYGALSTITRDALLNGAANVAVVGAPGRWEVIKFQRADDLGSGRYILSGLLRGLQGSEFAIAQHAPGDRFVLMSDGGVLRPNFDPGTIGQDMAFKAVSVGRRFDSASVQTNENTGEGLRPSSPTTLRKSFSTNDIVLTWGRRTRLSQQWWLGNVPLGEESERYEIDIFSDNTYTTLKRTLTSTSATVTYTSAQQVADFGSNQTTVYVRIYQMSGAVGRGHELQQAI